MMRLIHGVSANESERRVGGRRDDPKAARLFTAFVAAMTAVATLVLATAVRDLLTWHLDYRLPILAVLTIASGRFAIKLPGRNATVGVSEVFVFATVLLFGAGPATLVVALDGLYLCYANKEKHLPRLLFNVAESTISTWTAGQVFFTVSSMLPQWHAYTTGIPLLGSIVSLMPTIAMTAVYFSLNSVLISVTLALESRASAYAIWKRHAVLLAVNYYAAASLATLGAAGSGANLSLAVVGMVAPLLVLSFVAYREAATRVDEAQQHVKDVEHLYHSTIETLVIAVDAKDQITHGHIRRVQRHTIALAEAMGISDEMYLKALDAAAVLHDVGKLAVPDYVLNKPGTLSYEEYETMKLHATKGANILEAVEFPYPVVPIVRHHHEFWDGRGYPDGISGESIPVGARILAIVDCFDALTSHRPYRRKLRDDEAIEMIRERSGTAYDPRIVERFVEILPELRREDQIDDENIKHIESIASEGTADLSRSETSVARKATIAKMQRAGAGVVERLTELLPGTEACLFTVSPAGDALLAALATPLVEAAAESIRFPVGEGLSGWVAANRHTIVNSDPGLDFGDQATHLGLRSATATPIFACGTVAGALTVYSRERGAFSDRQGRIIGMLAQEIGMELVRRDQLRLEARPGQVQAARA